MRRIIISLAATLALSFQLSAQAKLKVLHNFAAFGSTNDGSIPFGPLVLDAKGNVYGVTIDGGDGCPDYGCGTVFELSARKDGSWNEKILYDFTGVNGSPWGALIFDAAENIYGTTMAPATNSGVFELSRNSDGWSYGVVYAAFGTGPGLLSDNSGDLYGDIGPGLYKAGAIGELSPGSSGWTYTDLYNYCETYCPDGDGQPAPPIWDSKGNLWGVTTYGGISSSPCVTGEGCGVIFEMTPNDDGVWTYNVVHRFASSPADGQLPVAGLTLDGAGNFYGNTEDGGTHSLGVIFKFSVIDGKLKGSIIHNFSNCSTGCYPEGTLAIDKARNLYGMAQGGTNSCGGLSCGVVYKLAPQTNGTWKYSVVYNLNETSGGTLPYYGLILDSKGNLYGVTSSAGQYGGGTAFEITP